MVTELKNAGLVRILELIIGIMILFMGANLTFSINRATKGFDDLVTTVTDHSIEITILDSGYNYHEKKLNEHERDITNLEECATKTTQRVLFLEGIVK